jgi:hypothetical protein
VLQKAAVVTTRPATRVLMALEPAYFDLMWAEAKHIMIMSLRRTGDYPSVHRA